MKKLISATFLISIICCLVGSFAWSSSDIMRDENRRKAEFPEFCSSAIGEYFEKIDRFAGDNFPGRAQLVSLYRWIINSVGDQVNANKAFRGRDGWFFLGNDYANTVDKLEGRVVANVEESALLNRVIKLSRWFQKQGTRVIFVLGPSKSSVYPEKLPAIIKPSAHRYVSPFLDKLRENGIYVLDPTEELLVRKRENNVYFATDTHWNQIGASIAVEGVLDGNGVDSCPSWRFEPAGTRRGDLINIGLFEDKGKDYQDNFHVVWKNPVVLDEEIIEETDITVSHQKTKVIENRKPANVGSLWIIGDSFRNAMVPFFSACFSRTTSMHIHRNSTSKLQAAYASLPEKPSYIVFVITERSI